MAAHSGIEWTDHTFNPWWGCAKVSPACDFCYAERDAHRYQPKVTYWGVEPGHPLRLSASLKPIAWNPVRASREGGNGYGG